MNTISRNVSRLFAVILFLAGAIILVNLCVENCLAEEESAQPAIIPFDEEHWDLKAAQVMDHLGRQALVGYATLKNVELENGVIEADIAVDGRTSYPGIIFRMKSEGEYERVYIRPHRESLYPDAVQYVASFNGIDSWQLYNGLGYTAAARIPTDQWIHMKIEVNGSQARLFLGDGEQPILEVKHLEHGTGKGGIALYAPGDRSAFFSNFQYRADDSLKFPPAQPQETLPGILTDWEISQVFKANKVDMNLTPGEQGIKEIVWQKVKALPNGMIDVSRYHGRMGTDPDIIWARTTIHSDKDAIKEFSFGYSDYINIFLNGKILFGANSAYRQRDPSFLGIVGLNDSIHLPLKKGDNELLILVAESFGGWAFIFQDVNAIFEHARLKKLWELPHALQYPESVVYDKKRDILYVSNFFNNGQEFISRVKLNGEIETLEWITGLNRPSGMAVVGDTLYAVDRTGIVQIDLTTSQIANRLAVPQARFLNDVAVDANGNIYVSDSVGNCIFRSTGAQFEIWLQSEETTDPNGLLIDGGKLIIGTSGDGCIKSADIATKAIRTIACIGSGSIMDGLRSDGKGNYIISDFNGRVFLVSPAGATTQLLDTRAPKKLCADFEYIAEKKLLLIPTLNDNRIMVYELSE